MLPRLLVIDDLFGRGTGTGRNAERENLCAHFLWRDVSEGESATASPQRVLQPTADVVFFRGQTPVNSRVGTVVDNDVKGSVDQVRRGWTEALKESRTVWSMVLLDLCFYTGIVTEESNRQVPGMPEGRPADDVPEHYFGLELLDEIHRAFPELPVMILSSKPREEVSLGFSQRGALGFIARDDLRGPELLAEAIWQHGLLPDLDGELVGRSLPMLLALREARRAAGHRENVLLRGERGTGKELMAGYIHRMAALKNAARPFVIVNSAVFTPNLFASELFGIEPKTATGVDGKIGMIEAANSGDLFLDEIGDMPSEVQAAMLRVLQERQIQRIGSRLPKPVDVRFISATNADVESDGKGLRADMLDRLREGATIYLPSLRERPTDIPLLVEKFVREAEQKRRGAMNRTISRDALEVLITHEWPGNVRELRTCIFDAVNRHPDVEYLVPGHIRLESRQLRAVPTDNSVPAKNFLNKIPVGIQEFFGIMRGQEFPSGAVSEWAGQLDALQLEYVRMLSRYLLAALEATKRRTPGAPDGEILIHPAVKLLTGDSEISASKAADVVKRLLSPIENEIEGDLNTAYRTAIRLRPKSTRTKSTSPKDHS